MADLVELPAEGIAAPRGSLACNPWVKEVSPAKPSTKGGGGRVVVVVGGEIVVA
jgi:hypothetical protein